MAFLDAVGDGQDLVLYDKFLKEWYMAKWIDLLNNLTTTYKMFRRRIVPFKGRRMVIALRTTRSGAVSAVPLSGYTPAGGSPTSLAGGAPVTVTPGYQGTDNAHVRPKVLMCGIGIPQDTIDVSADEKGAFYDVIDFEMMGIKTDCANYQDQLCYSGGAALAQVATGFTPANNAIEVTNAFPFFKNKRLEFFTGNQDNSRIATGGDPYATVASVDRTSDPQVINLVSNLGGSASPGDGIWTASARSSTGGAVISTSYEPLGLEEIVSASNLTLNNYEGNQFYLNRDRTVNDEWKSQELPMGGPLTFEAMQTMIDDIHDNSGGEPTVIFTNRPVRRQYAKKCGFTGGNEGNEPTLRFQGTTRYKQSLVAYNEDSHYVGGNDYMYFDERLPIVVDRYCTWDKQATNGGTMYFIDSRHMYFALVTDWKWWAPEGRILREAQGNLFGIQAHAYILGDLVCDAPNTCGKITAIEVS